MPVTAEQALLASKHVSAVAYVETTSAYVSKAVPEAFELAAQAALGLLNSKKNLPKKVSQHSWLIKRKYFASWSL